MLKFTKIIKQNNGFSFIEALVTVVIVGIIIVPISTIFIGALKDNVKAKEKLITTQLAQLFMENIKAKPEADFMNFFQDNTSPATSDTPEQRTIESNQGYQMGFSNIPDGYKIRISYDKGTDFLEYKNINEPVLNYDAVITFDDNLGKDLRVNNNTEKAVYSTDFSSTDRIIYIEYNESNYVQILDGNKNAEFTVLEGFPILFEKNYYNIKLELKDTKTYNPSFDTKVYVKNKTLQPVNMYIYEYSNNSVNLSINDTKDSYEGKTKIFYNMNDSSLTSHKVYKIMVEVLNDKNEVLTKLEGTKIDE